MTRKEMKAFTAQCDKVVTGYCCRYDAGAPLIVIGKNSGVYGWNWTLYYCPTTNTAYVDGYRNF